MNSEYKVRDIFNESGETLSEVVSKLLISFLDKNFSNRESNGIINADIISNL